MSDPKPLQNPKSVYLEDMGCQMNRIDSELVLGRLRREGYRQVTAPDDADVLLYYTCSVRENAEDKVYGHLGAIKALKQQRPEMVVGVMGCMAQNHKEGVFKKAPHVDMVVGTSRFEDVVELLEQAQAGERVLALDRKDLTFDRDISVRPRPYQAFIAAMRGCNKFCTFCIVPFTQGRERSRSADEIVEEARRLCDDGVIEVTLLGQRIDAYGLDHADGNSLGRLLARLHEEVPGLARISFVTSHPNHMTDELARAVADHPRISRYLHLPVQSGSDAILRAMNRGYTLDGYRRAVDIMRRRVDDLSLATDWIVGFPGESEADFEASVDLMREMEYQGSFIFQYSPRSGTRAFDKPDDVPAEEKSRRNQVLLDLQRDISLRRNQRRVGQEVDVLVEGLSKKNSERWTGRTDRNLIVCFPAARDLTGKIVRVRLTDCTALTLFGALL